MNTSVRARKRTGQSLQGILTLLLAAILFLLAACVPVASSNPSIALQDANATAAAANVYLGQTEQARQAVFQAATLEAAQTQDVWNRQATSMAVIATSTQEAILGQATQTQMAASFASTQTSQAVLTEIAHTTATAAYVQTATSFPQTQVAAVATSAAIQSAVQDTERRAFWAQFTTPIQVILPVLLLGAIGILFVVALVRGWPRLLDLLEAFEIRARTIISPDGEVITYLPSKRQMDVLQPKRNFGAALRQGPDGVSVQGMAPDPLLQADTTARQQAAILAHHLPAGNSGLARRLLQPTTQPAIRVLQPDEPLPAGLLVDPNTLEVLDAQWRDAHERP